ncbi:hypothetical protein QQ045_029730 [Rhodiola kirilowii]
MKASIHHHLTTSQFRSRFHKPPWWDQILDPGSEFVTKWNRIFLCTSLMALFLDPLYLFLPIIVNDTCMEINYGLGVTVTIFRSFADWFHLMHILMKFRIAFVAPSSRVFGRGDLVMDKRAIAMRYLKKDFLIDVAAAMPIPQVVIWFVIPKVRGSKANEAKHTLALMVLLQYIPRFLVIFPLNRQLIKSTGAVAKTAWSGAAYNLLLYILASHVLGASWYLLSIEKQLACWGYECWKERNGTNKSGIACNMRYLDCMSSEADEPQRDKWLKVTKVLTNCDPRNEHIKFNYGMFADAFKNDVATAPFRDKYFYCLWFGLKNLTSYGQNFITSTDKAETLFSSCICIAGLVLFSHLIGQMQNYLQSSTIRLEEWRVKRRDTEEWMRHRQLPPDLQDRVRRFVQYKWLATRGVDEESILRALPLDLRREIQRHLCLGLVRRVPFFSQMDNQLLDAICEHLVSALVTKDTYIVREGDPVNEMLFVIRGQLESSTTDGGRSGFYNSIILRAGDFCGEELLTWALMPTSSLNLPVSTRTVKSLTEVEAFALRAEDLKFVASQFKRLHSKKLQHAFRYYSHQWRTWGACLIQAAWKRFKKRKQAEELARQESYYYQDDAEMEHVSLIEYREGGNSQAKNAPAPQHLGATILASKFAANTRKVGGGTGESSQKPSDKDLEMPKLFKPSDFFPD